MRDSRTAQRSRAEPVALPQLDAQDRYRQEKQQAKLERKQMRSEYKQMYQAQYDPKSQKEAKMEKRKQHSLPLQLFPDDFSSTQLVDVPHRQQQYHEDSFLYQHQQYRGQPDYDGLSSSASSTTSRSSRNTSDRIRPLSLKSNTKSMSDLRFKDSKASSYDNTTGYDSDDTMPARSFGWDSLMETLHSPTTSCPSDSASWDSRDEADLDLMDSMNGLNLSQDNGNGNGKYLLVLGANGRTGIELVKQGLERNYRVTAFVRDDKSFLEDSSLRKNQNLLIVRGSPTSQIDVDRVVEGQDVVVNVIGARLMSNDTTIGSHSQVILNNALKKHGVRRLIVVTSYGCLGLRNYLVNTKRLFSRVFMTGILKDKVLQEDIVQRDSEFLDWTIVRPITLKDGDLSEKYWVSNDELPKANKVKILSRKDLAHYLLTIINRPQEYKAIRSIAGKRKNCKPSSSFCSFDKRKEGQEPAKQQEIVRGFNEKRGY
ncbi:hypothetical protein BGX34_004927 [Mortierella sp. NVP85]|nr:hypothetical protein BGX34_004927 [Mortierella sp. NVP85]